MANEEKDVIRIETTEATLQATLISGQLGFATDTNKMGRLQKDGITMDWWSSDQSTWLYWTSAGWGGVTTTSPDGKFHIYTSSAGSVTASSEANELVLENNNSCGMTILSSDGNESVIAWGSTSKNIGSFIAWNYDSDEFSISTLKNSGEIKIYTGLNSLALTINSGQNFIFPYLTNNAIAFIGGGSTAGYLKTTSDLTYDQDSGRLGINSDSPNEALDVIGNIRNSTLTASKIVGSNVNKNLISISTSSAFTQTYSATTKTHSNLTVSTLTDSSGGSKDNTISAITDQSETTDNSVINDNFAELTEEINALRTDLINTKQILNSIIDDLQTINILG